MNTVWRHGKVVGRLTVDGVTQWSNTTGMPGSVQGGGGSGLSGGAGEGSACEGAVGSSVLIGIT